MSLLYIRLQELRDEYFNKLTNEQLYVFFKSYVSEDEKYTSDELIKLLANYEDSIYPRI